MPAAFPTPGSSILFLKGQANGARAHSVHRQARRRQRQSHRRGLSPVREGRPVGHRRAHAHLSQREAEGFYAVHRERPFFKDLVRYMTSGPVIVQVLEGEEPSRATASSWAPPTRRRQLRAPSAPTSPRASSRTSCTARTRRHRCARDRLLLQRHGAAPARLSAPAPWNDDRRPRQRTNLLGLPRPALEAFVEQLGSKPFRARQLMNWVYKRGVGSFGEMTDLAKDFRAQLARAAPRCARPEIVIGAALARRHLKWLLSADAAQAFEMVFIPEPDRGTLCISSQVGCALDCSFCSTAPAGLQPQPQHRGDRRPGVARGARADATSASGSPQDASRRAAHARAPHHQRRADGHGRAAGELPQRRARAAISSWMISASTCRAGA